jgi:hypothetical protein
MTTGSRSAYAEHIGATPAYVTKLGHQGRLVERDQDGKRVVDFDLTDRLVKNTTDLARASNGSAAKADSSPITYQHLDSASDAVAAVFRRAQAQEKAFDAKMAELAYKKAIGELVLAADVRSEFARLLAALRESLLQMPGRIVPLLVAAEGAAAMDAVLRDAIVEALTQISHVSPEVAKVEK